MIKWVSIIATNFLVRKLVLFLIKLKKYLVGIFGLIRFKALVKNSGSNSLYNIDIDIKYGENITIGDNVLIGPCCSLGAKSKITIGNYVRISRGVIIETAGLNLNAPPPYKHTSKPIVIEDGVWVAANAIILGGVTIGENSIIGAGTVVTKDVAPYSIIVGAAGKGIKKTNERV